MSKNHLTRKELDEFREMLVAKRRQLIGDVSNMESEAMRSNNQTGTGSSSMPIHMADLGSDTWEQELTLGLIENERGLIREIDEALSRIEDHTYGICIATGKPIAKARLRAKPWAKYCIEHARKLELGLL
ncbi:MAG: TraR/DksA family transcriptional regulator [Phycisphaerae bacterium]|nr:TraR/DksA family transcriptional regulator [Phycisphaerae bacterium]